MFITDNKYEWSIRRLDELEREILYYQDKLQKTQKFFSKMKYKRKIKKLIKEKYRHGNVILEYENQKALQNENRNGVE